MNTKKHGNSWRRAVVRIEQLIAKCQAEGVSHLPNIRELARQCDVSQVTMRGVLHYLEKWDSTICVRDKVGVFLNPCHEKLPIQNTEVEADYGDDPMASEMLRNTLAADIRAGCFQTDAPLPSFKELRRRYSRSDPTIRKALQELCNSGLIKRQGRGYWIVCVKPRSVLNTIVLIARVGDRASLCNYTYQSAEFWRTLEQECQKTNIAIRTCDCTTALNELRNKCDRNEELSGDKGIVLGYMVWVLGLTSEELQQIGIYLSRLGAPVAWLDETGAAPVPLVIKHNPLSRFYSVCSTPFAGEILGSYLIGLGHRGVAFFSPSPECPWSDNRGIGISEAYRKIGLKNAVKMFSLPDLISNELVQKNLVRSLPIRQLDAHRKRFSKYYGASSPEAEELFYEKQSIHLLSTNFWSSKLEPLFEQALCNPSLSAWVGSNDMVALLAMDFLKKQDIVIPDRISVVGFDDSLNALGRGMNSYNFNISAVIRAMHNHILNPKASLGLHRKFPLEIPGIVMDRGSCGPPPTRYT